METTRGVTTHPREWLDDMPGVTTKGWEGVEKTLIPAGSSRRRECHRKQALQDSHTSHSVTSECSLGC